MAKKKLPTKKKPTSTKVKQSLGTPVLGQVILELSMWNFDSDPMTVEYHVEQLAKAILLNYGIQNFGVGSFGISEE